MPKYENEKKKLAASPELFCGRGIHIYYRKGCYVVPDV
jgi:hypothetical protein